jgi:DNA-directed RNA polymerase specialized sigma24 family protein
VRFEEIEALERRVANRDVRAFDELERVYTHLVQHFVFTKVNSQARARAITERVFQHAWENIENYPWRDFSFHVWILRIARERLNEETGAEPPFPSGRGLG